MDPYAFLLNQKKTLVHIMYALCYAQICTLSWLVIYTPKMHLCVNALLCTIICIFIGNNLWTNSFSPSCFAWTPPWFREDFKNWIYAFESLHENHFPNYSNNNIASIIYSVSYLVPTFSATYNTYTRMPRWWNTPLPKRSMSCNVPMLPKYPKCPSAVTPPCKKYAPKYAGQNVHVSKRLLCLNVSAKMSVAKVPK